MKSYSSRLAVGVLCGVLCFAFAPFAAASSSGVADDARIGSTVQGKNDISSVVYVEVNSSNILNAGSYTMAGSGKPFFDMAIIFAANINASADKQDAKLHFNENVTHVLKNKNKYIRPLQDKGIKVTLSILGNHDGIGFANLTDNQIESFSNQLVDAVNKYGLDGIDFDDEYADYGKGFPSTNATSYGKLILRLRDKMPDKIITCYDIGHSAEFDKSIDGREVGQALDYAWYAYYGSTKSNPTIAGLGRAKWGPSPFHIDRSPWDPSHLSADIKSGGYGVNMNYNLTSADVSDYLSKISQQIYGVDVKHSGKSYSKDW